MVTRVEVNNSALYIHFHFNFKGNFSSVPEPTPSTMTALHLFGAEMLKLSRGLDSVSPKFERKEITLTPLNNKINASEMSTNIEEKTCEKERKESKTVKTSSTSKRCNE